MISIISTILSTILLLHTLIKSKNKKSLSPLYNVSAYLKRCIDSVVQQTYENLDIILVDDGSTDNSGVICDDYMSLDSRIRVIHKENGGLSDARNKGIEMAKGKYITFIDSDDYVDDDYIEYLYRLIKKYNTKMSICSHTVVYDNGTLLNKETGEENVISSENVLERILYDEDIDLSTWAKLYDLSLFKNIKFPVGRLYEDAATTYKLVHECNKVAIGLKSKLNYMIRNDSITNVTFSKRKLDLITSTKEMTDFVKDNYPHLSKAADRRLIYAYLSTLSQLANSSVKDKDVECFLMDYIKDNGNKVLIDKRSKTRDKIGILSTKFGFRFYQVIWVMYKKITGRN